MTELGIAGGLLGFWLFMVWRVRVEQGWVGITPARRALFALTVATCRAAWMLAEALTPALREATRKIAAFADGWESSSRTDGAA